MQDRFGRTIEYLRVSVTDKCNLRCKYCMPAEGVERIPHDELLTLEEMARVIRICSELGVRGVRFTGGEPLVRKSLEKLIADIHANTEITELAITTNGMLLAEKLPALLDAGITAVNISLDTLDRTVFEQITGVDGRDRVLEAVHAAVDAGLRTKINCVPCREWNAEGLELIAALARELPVDVRFIELMPVGCGKQFHGIGSGEVLAALESVFGKACAVSEKRGNGPAAYYSFRDFMGQIGYISPLSHQFCDSCNRIRLTAEGRLKLCLHYDTGIELKPLLRGGAADEQIRREIEAAVYKKPRAHSFLEQGTKEPGEEGTAAGEKADQRKMVQIGG